MEIQPGAELEARPWGPPWNQHQSISGKVLAQSGCRTELRQQGRLQKTSGKQEGRASGGGGLATRTECGQNMKGNEDANSLGHPVRLSRLPEESQSSLLAK